MNIIPEPRINMPARRSAKVKEAGPQNASASVILLFKIIIWHKIGVLFATNHKNELIFLMNGKDTPCSHNSLTFLAIMIRGLTLPLI